MKIRAQICMVMNLDKCIGCHTCSIGCKQVWTTRQGMEYAWWNNVESKPGIGYPKEWEDQSRWKGGWVLDAAGRLKPVLGNKATILAKIFANPSMPQIDEYYEPFDYEYSYIHYTDETESVPTARPVSQITGQELDKINWGPNWEEMLSGDFESRSRDQNFHDVEKAIYGQFVNTFLLYLPRICEHCLNPSCLAVCPSGAIYKREEDGIVLIDQEKCRGWRMCVSGCPYKKIYYNWHTGKSEKCIFCYPRIESGQTTVCSETCVGRIRSVGVMLYDADRIAEAASVRDPQGLYEAHLSLFLDPADPSVAEQARAAGIPDAWMAAARRSPVYDLAVRWRLAFPLHPEYRTLPMVWYVPPLSPIQAAAEAGVLARNGDMPDVRSLRIPIRFLANLLTAGDDAPIIAALERMLAMRAFKRLQSLGGTETEARAALDASGLTVGQAEAMFQLLSLGDFEDRFVIPTSHKEVAMQAYDQRGIAGFNFTQTTTEGNSRFSLFAPDTRRTRGERFPMAKE